MTKLPVHGTRSHTGSLKKKNDTAADDLQKLVDRETLKMREDNKKKQADEKKAEEEKKKKSDQEKAAANSVKISPPSTNDDDALTILTQNDLPMQERMQMLQNVVWLNKLLQYFTPPPCRSPNLPVLITSSSSSSSSSSCSSSSSSCRSLSVGSGSTVALALLVAAAQSRRRG